MRDKPADAVAPSCHQLTVRLTPELLRALDQHVAERRRAEPGRRIGRTDVLRAALHAWLRVDGDGATATVAP